MYNFLPLNFKFHMNGYKAVEISCRMHLCTSQNKVLVFVGLVTLAQINALHKYHPKL